MNISSIIQLNIRQKVIFGIVICMVAIGGIGSMSYSYLQNIERKVYFVEIAEDLNNTILEMRRYEKNFFLYGQEDALYENLGYAKHAFEGLSRISPTLRELRGGTRLEPLRRELLAYQGLVRELHAQFSPHMSPDSNASKEVEEALRVRGKKLVDLAEELVDFERKRILDIIKDLKTQLLFSLLTMVVFGAMLIPFVSHKIIRPLRVIEETTVGIARGNFNLLPVLQTRDETQRVVEAFNRMVKELEKRQDQLVQAKKLTSIGVLTSGVAHQLNNPLNNISTSCQILLEELDNADRDFLKRMLTNVEQEVARARDIVKGLLEFSRIKEFSLMPIPLREIVERCVRLVSSQVPSDISISLEIPEALVLHMDSQRMQQVFLNLFMNAIDAIKPPGEIKIRGSLDRERGQVKIEVADTGSGIAEADLEAIFDPFFTTKDVGAGTGLGLSIVYGIIEKHHGTIRAESRLGEGTRFIINLPIHPDNAEKRTSK